ncbi:MAG: T9SS type A sorting domain-containing protein, partial [Bacteroidetes bacterium]|nr:T9SS type A sorting domain-containing protein [Bacteroidota bacterium]
NNLYLVTASNHVFKTNISTRVTQYLGTISGLPQKFTANGAAVDEDGNIIVSSSMYTESYFSVDPKTWAATPYKPMSETYSSADLANSNVLHTSPASLVKLNTVTSNKIKAYPNPVANNEFNVQFNNLNTGNYSIQLTDEFGSELLHKKIRVNQSSQTEIINISGYDAQGFYLLRVLDESNKTIFTQIMVVER